MKVKICRTCGAENSPADLECRGCMGDISGIRPVEKEERPEVPQEVSAHERAVGSPATVRDTGEALTLTPISAAGGAPLTVRAGDVLGRERVGKDLFAAYPTVSREHAKIARSGDTWTIEDISSTNGTYVNGRKLEPGQPSCPLRAGDMLALSISCELTLRDDADETRG